MKVSKIEYTDDGDLTVWFDDGNHKLSGPWGPSEFGVDSDTREILDNLVADIDSALYTANYDLGWRQESGPQKLNSVTE